MYTHLKEVIASTKGFPCVSIIIPTQRNMPSKAQVVTKLHNIIKDISHTLSAYPKGEQVIQHINRIIREYDFANIQDVLVILANEHDGAIFTGAGTVHETVTIGSMYALSEIYGWLQDQWKYWVLLIGKQEARLCQAENSLWHEIITPLQDAQGRPLQGFPLQFLRPEDKVVQAIGSGDRNPLHHDQQFFHLVHQELHKVLQKDPLPVVVCAAEKTAQSFGEATQHHHDIAYYIHYDAISQRVHEIAEVIWPKIHALRRQAIAELVMQLQEGKNHNRYAAGIQRVWEVILEGRVSRLFIESGVQQQGRIDLADNRHLQLFDRAEMGITDNVADMIVAAALQHNGHVTILPAGALREDGNVAALLRY